MIDDHVGFSGSRLGMNQAQSHAVYDFLRLNYIEHFKEGELWFHHGLCIGADEESHKIARNLGYKIHGHPSLDTKFTAKFDLQEFDMMDLAYSYHGRNQRINHACRILIATPYYKHQSHGGTWYTINHARVCRRPHMVIHRDGEIQREMYDA